LLVGGVVIGTGLGAMLAGFQSVMLIRMPAIGLTTPMIVVAAVVSASVLAGWLPARRALSIRPADALNTD
jgi:ABC-type antimicrobial peptide transport system permease subunit